MPKTSAALCLWRSHDGNTNGDASSSFEVLEVLIVHPGGPFWKNKHEGAWSLPKGEFDPATEDGLAAARREFAEETGHDAPTGPVVELGEAKLKSGKIIIAWACEGDLDPAKIKSNLFEMEWPPRSGKRASFPEIDQGRWCSPDEARALLNAAQCVFVDRLEAQLARPE